MKQLFKILIVALTAMAYGLTAMAQNDECRLPPREEIDIRQARYIAHELGLDKATADRYVETFCRFRDELWAIGPGKGLTTTQRLERSQQILDLRKKYHAIYSEFLTEPQLDRAYRLEKELMDRMGRHHRRPHRKKTAGTPRVVSEPSFIASRVGTLSGITNEFDREKVSVFLK